VLRTILSLLLFPSIICAQAGAIWQPIIDYTISFPGDSKDAAPMINPFENFTHMASDFGWMGPGEARIDSKGGIIHVKSTGEWTGAWHSLAGLASQSNRSLDPNNLTGLDGNSALNCGIRKLAVNVEGQGLFRVELADINRKVVWQQSTTLNSDSTTTLYFPIDPATLGQIKFMDWIAEPGCKLKLSSIGFIAERQEMPMEEWAFLISLGKLRRCHDLESGLTRDRGHTPAGKFDSIASTGMQSLASALGASEGILKRDDVRKEIARTISALETLPKAAGFLPHFTHRNPQGSITIVPGTEFSTVDTAIAFQSILLATQILDFPDLHDRVAKMIGQLDFSVVTSSEGWIGHGILDDGQTLLNASWRDWGGETALILALEAMVPGHTPRGNMLSSGWPYRGTGFIAEIQSLFYPQFDTPTPDRISNISWPEVRRKLLNQQINYPKANWPDSPAAMGGIFGLSAGEAGMPGAGYSANGIEVMGVRWLHPHYMMMSLALSGQDRYLEGLQALDARQFLYPCGLPENIEMDLKLHNPMQGSLNASFETISAYHGWKKRDSETNLIDKAARRDPLLIKGAARFYQ